MKGDRKEGQGRKEEENLPPLNYPVILLATPLVAVN